MRVITLDTNKIVTSVKNVGDNYILKENELETSLGEMGQIMQEDGSFITPSVEPAPPKPTVEEQLEQIRQDNLTLMKALADIYELLP